MASYHGSAQPAKLSYQSGFITQSYQTITPTTITMIQRAEAESETPAGRA